jgi:HD-GYP domain-containing protein (c-di-GMP phosphodiesterase class II)
MMKQPEHQAASTTVDAPSAHGLCLILPPGMERAVNASGLCPTAVLDHLPMPYSTSGIFICGPSSSVHPLPDAWVGVWARAGTPPSGAWIPLPVVALDDPQVVAQALRTAEQWRQERLRQLREREQNESAQKAVNEIGIALSSERNPTHLLELILRRARQLVAADAGSLYLIEKDAHGAHCLRFAVAQNDSVNAPWKAIVLPLNPRSIAGAVALDGEVVVVDDAYALPPDGQLRHDQSFDQRFGYRTRSIVGIPMTTREGEVLGVLQLINRKPQAGIPLQEPEIASEVLPFSSEDVELLRSLASQAGVSLENSQLYADIENLFEGFVHASITAIEQRDPTTSGHSFRVSQGTLALARKLERVEHGPWAGTTFSYDQLRELRYAALLHDFGKVGVREHILVKASKLYETELIALRNRFKLAKACLCAERYQTWMRMAIEAPDQLKIMLPQLQKELDEELVQYEGMLQIVLAANQPNVIDAGDFDALQHIGSTCFLDPDGETHHFLTPQEVKVLSIRRGSLSEDERLEIERHVIHTYNFLKEIPWTQDLSRIPEIAYRHHEKLDGTGYPLGLQDADIPLGARLMSIADIYDALTARDRPYKKAMPVERALSILQSDAQHGKLDASLVQIWIESKAWEEISES